MEANNALIKVKYQYATIKKYSITKEKKKAKHEH